MNRNTGTYRYSISRVRPSICRSPALLGFMVSALWLVSLSAFGGTIRDRLDVVFNVPSLVGDVDLFNADDSLSGANLSGANLSGADLSLANLTSADLSGANLSDVYLTGALLSLANFDGATLTAGDLTDADAPGAIFTLADLGGAFLSGANFTGAFFNSAGLSFADLSSAVLAGADLTSADLTDADLTSADLSNANLTDAYFSDALLEFANLTGANLNNAFLGGAYMPSADLTGADLTGAYFGGADLSLAILAGVDLTGVDLTGSTLSGANFSNAILASALLGGADLGNANFSGANLSLADLSGAFAVGANFSGANLNGANLFFANLGNVNLDLADLTDTTLNGVTSGGITGTPVALPAGWQLVGGVLVNIDLSVKLVSTDIADGANLQLGSLVMGDEFSVTFTITNTGNGNLTGLAITKGGLNPGDFTVGPLGSTTLVPNAATTFTVSFSPGAAGTRRVVLHIASNVVGSKNPYDINLSGVGIGYVVGRHIFYNQSAWDGNDAAAGVADDAAIAPDKAALLPGSLATFANYTGYSRGINGLMVDILGLPGGVTAADFTFKVGNTQTPASWAAGPAPSSVTIRSGAGVGGSDRVTLIWPNSTIAKQWLQVTVLANANTGLDSPDVFYFGNAVGESGNTAADAKVTSADALRVLNNITASAAITSPNDHNRDGRVASADRLIVLNNLSALQPLVLLDLRPPMALSGGRTLKSATAAPMQITWEDGAVRLGGEASMGGGSIGVSSTATLDAADWQPVDVAPVKNPYTGHLEFRIPVEPDQPQRFYRLETGGER